MAPPWAMIILQIEVHVRNLIVCTTQFTRVLDNLPKDIDNHENICLRELDTDCVKIK